MQNNNEELTYADHIRARGIDHQARDLAHVEAELASWIEHDGRGCPVEIHQLVNLRYRDGTIKRSKKAGDRCWVNYDRADDIAAYQIVTENDNVRTTPAANRRDDRVPCVNLAFGKR